MFLQRGGELSQDKNATFPESAPTLQFSDTPAETFQTLFSDSYF